MTFNQLVVGTIPTAGAIKNNTLANLAGCFYVQKLWYFKPFTARNLPYIVLK